LINIKGGDDINQLCEADEEEFKEICELVGMESKPLHVKRLRKALDEYKNTKSGKFFNLKKKKLFFFLRSYSFFFN
jgi:hypothetical protein